MATKEQSNYERFPDNIFEPEKIKVGREQYIKYMARFRNLYDLHEYLTSDPNINKRIFRELNSVTGSYGFAGKPYEEAVEDLISDMDPGYEEFLTLQRDINNATDIPIHKYRTVRTVAGGHLNIPAYSMGNPFCYETQERINKPRFVQIHVGLSYYHGTTKQQVLHRAIIITNILRALEKAGYSVDLDTFMLAEEERELLYIVVQIKRHGEKINMQALYRTLCHVEFLRRILFRVMETLDFRENWSSGYGVTCNERKARKVLGCDQNDIFFDQPSSMGIYGKSLSADFENAVKHLNIGDKIDVKKAQEQFEKGQALARVRKSNK